MLPPQIPSMASQIRRREPLYLSWVFGWLDLLQVLYMLSQPCESMQVMTLLCPAINVWLQMSITQNSDSFSQTIWVFSLPPTSEIHQWPLGKFDRRTLRKWNEMLSQKYIHGANSFYLPSFSRWECWGPEALFFFLIWQWEEILVLSSIPLFSR